MAKNYLSDIYPSRLLDFQKERYLSLSQKFFDTFGTNPTMFFSAPGRTEICGNHTDHQNGKVLAASISLDIIAAVLPTDDGIVHIKSEGYDFEEVDLNDLRIKKHEKNTSKALIRGVARGFADRSYKIGGFKAYTTSNVLKGSGLSSSAAFEVLIGTILNGLYNDYSVSDVEIAKIAQFSENVYFGKPSGLMDQMASSVGNFICIDFKNPKNPVIETINFDFNASGHSLCVIDTKGSHADLTPEYASIPREMHDIAEYFKVDVLRQVSKADIIKSYAHLRQKFGDRAVLRALHFVDCNERVQKEFNALITGDFNTFLSLVNESGDSSYKYLQNVFAPSFPKEQGLSTALYIAKDILGDTGACRVHGGGFAGTIQAFVPDDKLHTFIESMENVFGNSCCYVLDIRTVGGTEIIFDKYKE
ncbi:MAG: galactokinase family protein [Ruminococcus sp.]|nr:galactokinase family protein [Ruminococcus sp.]